MLQPDPRNGEGCITLLREGFANVNTRKRLLYRHCYIPSFLVQVFTVQSKNNLSKFLALKSINSLIHSCGGLSIPLKPASDIDWCPFGLHRYGVHDTITEQPSEITRRGLQRPLIHGYGGLHSH